MLTRINDCAGWALAASVSVVARLVLLVRYVWCVHGTNALYYAIPTMRMQFEKKRLSKRSNASTCTVYYVATWLETGKSFGIMGLAGFVKVRINVVT